MTLLRSMRSIGIIAALLVMVGAGMTVAGHGVRAQDATPTASTTTATISVNGDGSVLVEPDAASISLGVSTVQSSLAEAQAQAETQIQAVLASLKAAGIDDKDIQTSNYSVSLIQNYDQNGMPGEITGYQVNNQLSVTVRDLDKLGDILQSAITAGANTVYGINFIVTDSSAAQSQARTAAVADATKKAQELANAAGGTLGAVLSISESSSQPSMPVEYAAGAATDAAAKSVSISGGTNAVTVSVSMTFEMNQ